MARSVVVTDDLRLRVRAVADEGVDGVDGVDVDLAASVADSRRPARTPA